MHLAPFTFDETETGLIVVDGALLARALQVDEDLSAATNDFRGLYSAFTVRQQASTITTGNR